MRGFDESTNRSSSSDKTKRPLGSDKTNQPSGDVNKHREFTQMSRSYDPGLRQHGQEQPYMGQSGPQEFSEQQRRRRQENADRMLAEQLALGSPDTNSRESSSVEEALRGIGVHTTKTDFTGHIKESRELIVNMYRTQEFDQQQQLDPYQQRYKQYEQQLDLYIRQQLADCTQQYQYETVKFV